VGVVLHDYPKVGVVDKSGRGPEIFARALLYNFVPASFLVNLATMLPIFKGSSEALNFLIITS
jgi:hypothetical protein